MLSRHRLLALYDQARYCAMNRIPGAFVECGVWRGGAVAVMARANIEEEDRRRELHLFDSFEGIPEPDARIDGKRAIEEARRFGTGITGKLVANPQFYTSMGRPYGNQEDSQKLLLNVVGYPSAYLHYHKGFFEQTVPQVAQQLCEIALLRLDGDWFSSTKVCLDHLYDLVADGGIVSIDDYGAYEGCRLAVEDFFLSRRISPYLHYVDRENVFLIKSGNANANAKQVTYGRPSN